jgi:hypothetical protein
MASHDSLTHSTLDYASPGGSRGGDGVPGATLLSLGVALAAALVSFNALADAAGFAPLPPSLERADPGTFFLHFICGLAGGLLTFAFVRFAFIQGQAVVRGIQRSGHAPGQKTAFVILGVGAGCLILAAVTLLVAARPASGFVVQQTGFSAGAGLSTQVPLVTELLALLTFLVGAALLALGVWCCFLRAEPPVRLPSMTMPPAARGDGLPPPVPSSQQSAA